MKTTKQENAPKMNYEVFCFDEVEDGRMTIIQKEYFTTFEEATQFEKRVENLYYATSVTPLNEKAEKLMTR